MIIGIFLFLIIVTTFIPYLIVFALGVGIGVVEQYGIVMSGIIVILAAIIAAYIHRYLAGNIQIYTKKLLQNFSRGKKIIQWYERNIIHRVHSITKYRLGTFIGIIILLYSSIPDIVLVPIIKTHITFPKFLLATSIAKLLVYIPTLYLSIYVLEMIQK